MNILLNTLFLFLKALFLFVVWLFLVMGLSWFWQNSDWSKQHYQNDDVPDKLFRVLIINEQGIRQPETLENAQKLPPSQWVRISDYPPEACDEDCLRQTSHGTLVWHDEAALAYRQSEYRIESNRLVPVSFRLFTFFDVFVLMAMAAWLMKLAKYAFRCWQYRHSREKLKAYHIRIAKIIFKCLIVFCLFIILVWGLGGVQAA